MRHVSFDSCETTPRDIVVTIAEYPAATIFAAHTHGWGQFAYAASGVMSIYTDDGNWVVPPERAFWVPAGVGHEMRMDAAVTMLNAFVRPEHPILGDVTRCRVLETTPLLRSLLWEAAQLPAQYSTEGRAHWTMALLLDEIASMRELPLNAPLPADPRLAAICKALLDAPNREATLDEIAIRAGMSRRTFTRLFRAQTGMSFAEWRQQACLLWALVRIARGDTVTRVAADLGYTPSAFATLFRRVLGTAPTAHPDVHGQRIAQR